ncbi:MAG: hypothetical protein ABJE10_04750 [bacterium]
MPYAAMAVAFWGSILGSGFYFARRFARAAEARSANGAHLTELTQRVLALEEALDGARRDIERLETGQEFTTRLLSSRVGSDERPI